MVQASTRDILYLVTERGEAAAVPVHSLPEVENPSEGIPFWRASPLHEGDVPAALLPLPPKGERAEDWFVLTGTRQGMVKKSPLRAAQPRPTFTLVRVNEGDRLGWLRLTHGGAEVLLVTAGGMLIRFSEEDVRPMGLVAAGVMGMKFQYGDEAAGMDVLPQPGDVFLLASTGSAKRVPVKDFPRQGRYARCRCLETYGGQRW
jgi:DNA gyrase/topoisomerase IV subunit A